MKQLQLEIVRHGDPRPQETGVELDEKVIVLVVDLMAQALVAVHRGEAEESDEG